MRKKKFVNRGAQSPPCRRWRNSREEEPALTSSGAANLCKSGADLCPLASSITRDHAVEKMINMLVRRCPTSTGTRRRSRWPEVHRHKQNRKIQRKNYEGLPLKQCAKNFFLRLKMSTFPTRSPRVQEYGSERVSVPTEVAPAVPRIVALPTLRSRRRTLGRAANHFCRT